MFGLSWEQSLPYISLGVALLALFINFSKLFMDVIERKERKQREMKAKIVFTLEKPHLVIENSSGVDAYIKEITLDGVKWDESSLFSDERPTLIKGKQIRKFKVYSDMDNPYPSYISIEYSDYYSRKFMDVLHQEDFEV